MKRITRRTAIASGAAFAAGMAVEPTSIAGATAPTPTVRSLPSLDPMSLVHPELRGIAAEMVAAAGDTPPLSAATLAVWRQRMAGWVQPPLPDVPVTRRTVPGRGAVPEVDVYVVNAKPGSAPRPAILHTHGGGYVLGDAPGSVRPLQEIARALDCVCVSVDYALAPAARWPVSTEQNYAGLKWLHDTAGELGVDRARIAVLGESAGGGHAALLAIRARDRGEVPLAAQVLVYPMLDDRTGSSRAVPPYIGSFTWSGSDNRYGWAAFLGVGPGTRAVPAAAVPARVASVAGLPPTFIGVGSIDLFVEEDVDYALRLIAAGVPTELVVVPGAFHGFDMIAADKPVARTFTAAMLNAFRRAFAPRNEGTAAA